MLEEEVGPLSAHDEPFSEVLALADPGCFTRPDEWCGNSAPPQAWLMHAFLAQSVCQFPRPPP